MREFIINNTVNTFGWNLTEEYLKKICILNFYWRSKRILEVPNEYRGLQQDIEKFYADNLENIPDYIKYKDDRKEKMVTLNAKTVRNLRALEDYGIIRLNGYGKQNGNDYQKVHDNMFTPIGDAFIRCWMLYYKNKKGIDDDGKKIILNKFEDIIRGFVYIFMINIASSGYYRYYKYVFEIINKYGSINQDEFRIICSNVDDERELKKIEKDIVDYRNGEIKLIYKSKAKNNAWNYSFNDFVDAKILDKHKIDGKEQLVPGYRFGEFMEDLEW